MNELMRRLLFLPEQASRIAPEIDRLHYAVIGVTMIGWMGITIVAAIFLVRYRRRFEGQRTENRPPPLRLEIATVIFLLALFLSWWAVGAAQFLRLREPPADSLEVYVTGQQWMWKFAYADGHSAISVLTVPVDRPVKLMLTSRDVIHSFFVPAFRIKHDALPGRYTTVWFEAVTPGEYDIFCTEYCGLNHSAMLGKVVVLSADDYGRWLEETAPRRTPATALASPTSPSTALAGRGEHVAAELGCLGCHTLDGRPHIGPTWANVFGRDIELEGGKHLVVDEDYLTRSMMDPRAEIRAGFQPVMPSYQGLLGPAEAAALVELIKSRARVQTQPLIPAWTGKPPEEKP